MTEDTDHSLTGRRKRFRAKVTIKPLNKPSCSHLIQSPAGLPMTTTAGDIKAISPRTKTLFYPLLKHLWVSQRRHVYGFSFIVVKGRSSSFTYG